MCLTSVCSYRTQVLLFFGFSVFGEINETLHSTVFSSFVAVFMQISSKSSWGLLMQPKVLLLGAEEARPALVGATFSNQTVAWRSVAARSQIRTRSNRPLLHHHQHHHDFLPTPTSTERSRRRCQNICCTAARTRPHTSAAHLPFPSLHHSAPLPSSHVGRKKKKKKKGTEAPREQTTSGLGWK